MNHLISYQWLRETTGVSRTLNFLSKAHYRYAEICVLSVSIQSIKIIIIQANV